MPRHAEIEFDQSGHESNMIVARMVGASPEMDTFAHQVAAKMRLLASRTKKSDHKTPGSLAASVKVSESMYLKDMVLDREVTMEHEGIETIEWGGTIKLFGSAETRVIPGKHILAETEAMFT